MTKNLNFMTVNIFNQSLDSKITKAALQPFIPLPCHCRDNRRLKEQNIRTAGAHVMVCCCLMQRPPLCLRTQSSDAPLTHRKCALNVQLGKLSCASLLITQLSCLKTELLQLQDLYQCKPLKSLSFQTK